MVLFTGLISGCIKVVVQGPNSDGSSVLLKLSFAQGQGYMKRGVKTGSNIITDIINKEPGHHLGNIFKTHFSEAMSNLKGKIKR